MEFLKVVFLFLIMWQAPVILTRTNLKLGVVWWSFMLLATGLTGFIYLQFLK